MLESENLNKRIDNIILYNNGDIRKEIYKELIINQLILDKINPITISNDYPHNDLCLDCINDYINENSGYIYIANNPNNKYYKVGMTKNPIKRLKSLNSAGNLYHLNFIKIIETKDIHLENLIHKDLVQIGFSDIKIKEFFLLPLNLIENVINENVNAINSILAKYHI